MLKRKLAVFVHGWSKTGKQWKNRKHRLISLFEGYDYQTVALDMPGKYMKPDKGFADYAQFIAEEIEKIDATSSCPCCQQNWPIDEMVLVAHSMGGVASRLYLQDTNIGSQAIKRKIKKLITLASPHHGTSVAIEDGMEKVINLLTLGFIGKLENFHNSKCYKELKPGSDFVRKINELPFPPTTAFHSIWSLGDLTVTPTHSAVSGDASNYFIDNLGVHHIGVMHSAFTRDIVRGILDENAKIDGLQGYPAKCDCQSETKQWLPLFYFSEESDEGCRSLKKEYLWKCENTFQGLKCDKQHIQKWKPGLFGCNVGKMKQRLHFWRKTGLRKWVCVKCGKYSISRKHPQKYDRNGCVNPLDDWHRWHLVWYEWKCENHGCDITKKSRRIPPFLGCSDGIYDGKRCHSWYKSEKKYLFKFKCTGCGKIINLRE